MVKRLFIFNAQENIINLHLILVLKSILNDFLDENWDFNIIVMECQNLHQTKQEIQ